MVSNEMLLGTMNSDFSEKSFVMLYVKDFRKYLFIFSPNSLKWRQTRGCCVRWIQISARNICNVVCEECLQISIYIYPLFSQMVSHDMLLSVINSDFGQKSLVMLMSRCFWYTTCCWVRWTQISARSHR